LEERKTETKDGKPVEQVHARHILIGDQNANPFGGPPQSGRDKAKAVVEQEKAKKVLDEIVAKSHVKVPDTFAVKMPEPEQNQGLPPGFGPGGPPPAQEEPEPAKPKTNPPASKPQPKKR
jgi:hypothetical protein